jgi:hypothetical protein
VSTIGTNLLIHLYGQNQAKRQAQPQGVLEQLKVTRNARLCYPELIPFDYFLKKHYGGFGFLLSLDFRSRERRSITFAKINSHFKA